MAMTIKEFCDKNDACADGRKWALATGDATIDQIWQRDDLSHEWRMWIATRRGVLSDRDARLFACWCVRQVWHLLIDDRSRKAVEVAELFADGKATAEDLAAAWDAAWDAAGAAARDAARAAAWAAAGDSARDAAGAAVWAAAWSTAGVAARAAQSKWLRENTIPRFDAE